MIDVNNFIDIPWYPNYKIKISTNEVLSLNYNREKRSKVLSNWVDHGWHYRVWLYNWISVCWYWLHRIVMLIKEWPCPEWMEVCHNDGDPKNNHPDNLRYDTRTNNVKDSIKHLSHPMLWKLWSKHHSSRWIIQYTIWWDVIKEWGSISECSRWTNIYASSVHYCANGDNRTAKWFVFKYK